eukprot:CAMPEP_0174887212 /NCGR_PEP_ID=MMETSP0167-20121228/2462_1 /TAXON_ID=38298 /ORGANISM="Rhodella maculata, Strain CCMP736" /LENGTH=232 /DNA_ID=CAMNT_0016123593 /DNA_START=71 /DNA_END=769 /DNA_ORIENTATION=-
MKEGKPLWPIALVISAAQVFYNKLKGGLAGSTQHVRSITAKSKAEAPMNIEQRLVSRSIKQGAANSFTLYRYRKILHEMSTGSLSWKDINYFRDKCNKLECITTFTVNLADHADFLASRPATIVNVPPAIGPEFTPEECEVLNAALKRRRKSALNQWNTGDHKKLRLAKNMPHTSEKLGEQMITSGRRMGTSKPEQKTCHAPLHMNHSKKQIDLDNSCFLSFHTLDVIQFKP